jgi:hypothetical protein
MGSDTKWVPRSGIFAVSSVSKGSSYTETSGTNDYVEIIARKIGGIIRIAEEDLIDGPVDVRSTKKVDAARQMGYFFDNATLGTSAAANGTTVPYNSVLKAVRTSDDVLHADANCKQTTALPAQLSGLRFDLVRRARFRSSHPRCSTAVPHHRFAAADLHPALTAPRHPVQVQRQLDDRSRVSATAQGGLKDRCHLRQHPTDRATRNSPRSHTPNLGSRQRHRGSGFSPMKHC